MQPNLTRVVILISGSGSNLQAIIDAWEADRLPIEICAVIANTDQAYGLQRAKKHGLDAIVVAHKNFHSREAFDQALARQIDQYRPDLIVLAGFMRILSAEFTQRYSGKMLNIHPSLLPKYQGLHTHQRALDAGDKVHGATVHFVTEELDGGPPVLQAQVPILDGDSIDSLSARVLQQEHIIYPKAIQWFAEGNLELRDGRAFLNNTPLS